jgi:hypothetical protein
MLACKMLKMSLPDHQKINMVDKQLLCMQKHVQFPAYHFVKNVVPCFGMLI